jgi:hypothetical protein
MLIVRKIYLSCKLFVLSDIFNITIMSFYLLMISVSISYEKRIENFTFKSVRYVHFQFIKKPMYNVRSTYISPQKLFKENRTSNACY